MRNLALLVTLATLLAWACSPDDEDEPAATNSTSSSTTSNATPTEPALSADAITFALVEDSGDNNDKITTNANVVISGEVPEDAELSFVVMTNDTNHSNDVSTTGTNDFGLAPPTSGTLSVSVQATLTKDDETVMGSAFEYTLFSWPASVTASYTDNGETNDDGLTTESELTFAGFGVSGLDIKLSAYQITNSSTMMLENTVDIDEDDQLSLTSGYRINMRDVKPSLGANEKIHSITLEHTNGHVVDYTFNPGLDYRFAVYTRKFTVAEDPVGIDITANNILLVTSTNENKVYFYDTNGNAETIRIGGSDESNFGGQGNQTNQFDKPIDIAVGDGKIYVGDWNNFRLQIFEDDFAYDTNITTVPLPYPLFVHDGTLHVRERTYAVDDLMQGMSLTTTFNVNGIDIDGDDVYHVANATEDRLEAWTGSRTGGFVARGHHYSLRPSGSESDGNSSQPWDVVVGPTTGRVYVSDSARHQVVVLDYDGSGYTLVGVLGKATAGQSGTNDGEFHGPRTMLIHDGKLYVADQSNNRIQVFTVPE